MAYWYLDDVGVLALSTLKATPEKRSWSDQEKIIRKMLDGQNLSPDELEREVQIRKEMFERYSQPVAAAEERQCLLQDAYDAQRPGHRDVFLEAAKRSWT
jgi:hypothetical protein